MNTNHYFLIDTHVIWFIFKLPKDRTNTFTNRSPHTMRLRWEVKMSLEGLKKNWTGLFNSVKSSSYTHCRRGRYHMMVWMMSVPRLDSPRWLYRKRDEGLATITDLWKELPWLLAHRGSWFILSRETARVYQSIFFFHIFISTCRIELACIYLLSSIWSQQSSYSSIHRVR